MARAQKTLEERLDAIRLRKQQLSAREQKLQADQRDRDLRRRAKAEKLLVQLVLDGVGNDKDFREALLRQIEVSTLKVDDRDVVKALLPLAASRISGAANAA